MDVLIMAQGQNEAGHVLAPLNYYGVTYTCGCGWSCDASAPLKDGPSAMHRMATKAEIAWDKHLAKDCVLVGYIIEQRGKYLECRPHDGVWTWTNHSQHATPLTKERAKEIAELCGEKVKPYAHVERDMVHKRKPQDR